RINACTESRCCESLSLHDALPIYHDLEVVEPGARRLDLADRGLAVPELARHLLRVVLVAPEVGVGGLLLELRDLGAQCVDVDHLDRKSTRLNSSHVKIS